MGALASRFSPQAGTSGTVTVAAGCVVTQVQAHSTAGGTVVITPAGGSALPTITVPAGADWFVLNFNPNEQDLVDGATLAFTGTDGYLVAQKVIGGV
jgi:hypothetical protein